MAVHPLLLPSDCGIPNSGVAALSHRSGVPALTVNFYNVKSHYLSLTGTHNWHTYCYIPNSIPASRYPIGIGQVFEILNPTHSVCCPPTACSRPDLDEFSLGLNPTHGQVQTPLPRDWSNVAKSRARHRSVSGCTRSEAISDRGYKVGADLVCLDYRRFSS
jgi:hypothetical protein